MPSYSAVDVGFVLPKRPHHLDKIEDKEGILDLFISARDGTKIHIRSDSHLLYMWRDEGDALRTVGPVVKYGSLVYSVEKSPLLAWFADETTRNTTKLKHFIVTCANDVIDILSADDLIVDISQNS